MTGHGLVPKRLELLLHRSQKPTECLFLGLNRLDRSSVLRIQSIARRVWWLEQLALIGISFTGNSFHSRCQVKNCLSHGENLGLHIWHRLLGQGALYSLAVPWKRLLGDSLMIFIAAPFSCTFAKWLRCCCSRSLESGCWRNCCCLVIFCRWNHLAALGSSELFETWRCSSHSRCSWATLVYDRWWLSHVPDASDINCRLMVRLWIFLSKLCRLS